MDRFYVFEYKLSPVPISYQPEFCPISFMKYTRINLNKPQVSEHADPENITQFTRLDEDITEQKVLFKKMLQQILKSIAQFMNNFTNVTLVCDDIRLFTEIIPNQCERRGLQIPYLITNFINIKQIARNHYKCPYKTLQQISHYLDIFALKDAEKKTKTELIQKILKKIHQDSKILTTTQRFKAKFQKSTSQKLTQNENFKYYKIIGLPFKSIPAEILQILASEVNESLKDICFLYERQRFSGRGIIKIPADYEKFLIQKNRMYIGQRYIQLQMSSEQQFEKNKIIFQQKPLISPIKQSFHDQREQKREQSRNTWNIGRRRSHSHSPDSRDRSRERRSNLRQRDQLFKFGERRPFDHSFHPSQQFGIKVRGLPFAFSQWDVQNVFNHHNIIGGTVKLGLKPGTMFKNGEAVILMKSFNDAQRALQMNGFRCMGRYLEVRVINKDQYMKYK